MPRKLPWETAIISTAASIRSTNAAQPVRERRTAFTAAIDSPDENIKAPRPSLRRDPSTSPPPLPPPEERMRENGRDDVWIMVEDEFYSTAQLFSRHLHHAEYKRLEKLAAERTAMHQNDLLENNKFMDLSSSERRIASGKKNSREIPESMNDIELTRDDRDSENGSIIPDRSLAYLMQGRRKKGLDSGRTPLSPQKSVPRTRAAAGFSRPKPDLGNSGHKTGLPCQSFSHAPGAMLECTGSSHDDETDDDLELPPREISNKRKATIRIEKRSDSRSSDLTSVTASAQVPSSDSANNGFLFDDIPRAQVSGHSEGKKVAVSLKSDKGSRKSIKLDEIPTFLV